MWMVDAQSHRITMANRAAEKLFGYSADELMSMTIYDIVAPEEADKLRENFEKRGFAGSGGMWTLCLPNGTRYRVRTRYHYVEREDAKLQFTFADEIHGHPDFPEGKTKGTTSK